VEISHSEDTPDEFFDALDEFFGTDDGYTHHLSRIYAMKDKIASLQASEAKLEAENERILDRGSQVASDLFIENEKLRIENEKLKEENEELKEDLDHMGIERADNTSEIETLFKFITGGGEAEDVEEIIVEKMSKEFIDSNQEHWDQMELFQEVEDYKDDEVDYYVDAGRKVVLKDGRVIKSKD
tara:strand:+ start:2561 stop:3112 length:552 start_codon:yes stop_codon:yes gene_type:complete